MKKALLLASIFATFVLTSCNNTKEKIEEVIEVETDSETPDNRHNSKSSLDWAGTYEGVLPCADCPGIKTTLILNDDETYHVEQVYEDLETEFSNEGTFKWNDAGSIVYLKVDDNMEFQFKIEENQVRMLNQKGKAIEGEHAESYVLNRK